LLYRPDDLGAFMGGATFNGYDMLGRVIEL